MRRRATEADLLLTLLSSLLRFGLSLRVEGGRRARGRGGGSQAHEVHGRRLIQYKFEDIALNRPAGRNPPSNAWLAPVHLADISESGKVGLGIPKELSFFLSTLSYR